MNDNIQQRVFDAFPPFPQYLTIYAVFAAVNVDARSVIEAMKRLMAMKRVEKVKVGKEHLYRRCKGARRPPECRGGYRPRAGRPDRKA